MSKQANPTLIGSFVLGAIAIIVFALLVLGNLSFNDNSYRCVLYFDGSLHGLDIGAPVAYRGVTVGKVSDIAITFNQKEHRYIIPVYVEINEQAGSAGTHYGTSGFDNPDDFFRSLIARGLRAKLKLRSMVTGKLFIEFFFAPDTEAKFTGGDTEVIEIPTRPSGLEQLTQTLEDLPVKDMVHKTMTALDAINKLVGSEELQETIPALNSALKQIDSTLYTAEQQMPDLSIETKQVLAEFSSLIQSTRIMLEQTNTDVSPLIKEIRTSFFKISSTLDLLAPVADNLNEITAMDSALQYELPHTLQKISDAAQAIQQLSDYLQRHPETLLTGRKENQ
jgi:paraquat-inducible protein B